MTHAIAVPASDVGWLATSSERNVDPVQIARLAYLAGYKGRTLAAYVKSLDLFLDWCRRNRLDALKAQRGHIEAYVRWLEEQGWASATVAARYDCVRGFYRAADRDDALPGKDPCTWVKRPKVDHEAQRRTYLETLAFGRFCAAATEFGPQYRALIDLLGVNALRVAEVCSLNIENITVESGYTCLHFVGKGHKSASVPLSVPVMRSVDEAIDGRTHGPVIVTKHKSRMTPTTARRMVKQVAAAAGVDTSISCHSLRRSFATTAAAMGVPLHDIQTTLRHADPKTTTVYIQNAGNHDRNSTHRVASFMSGLTR